MRLVLSIFLLAFTIAWGAEDPWQKARALATGSDIRIYNSGSTKPISGKMAGIEDGKVQVIVKNDQIAIKQSDIDRIDYRPAGTKTKTESNGIKTDGFGTTQSASSGTSWGREGWQTAYRKSR